MSFSVLEHLNLESVGVDICLVKPDEAELKREYKLDEVWSLIEIKANQRWLWHAIKCWSEKVLAYTFYTDNGGAYERHLDRLKHDRLAKE